MITAYPCFSSSFAQRSGAPLDRGPRPLQSCMITTAGKGPTPSGFKSLNGISSDTPLALLIDNPEVVALHPARKKRENISDMNLVGIVRLKPALQWAYAIQ
jgi:hypothetical protein